ncbi:hypothetical protein HAX54_005195, partial [Datura stramonium]|nr:hypothetical protein [Datura stramonium]
LASQIESEVNVDARGPLMEMVTRNPECGKCYWDRIIRSGKPPHVRMESVDGDDYREMLFEESLEAILLKYNGGGIEEFEE